MDLDLFHLAQHHFGEVRKGIALLLLLRVDGMRRRNNLTVNTFDLNFLISILAFPGFYKIEGNVETTDVGIRTEAMTKENPKGLGIVPSFYPNGTVIPGSIDTLYEPYLCSMGGEILS